MPELFNVHGFEPPRPVRGASFCPWVDHSASGLPPATHFALFRLAFATAPPRERFSLATEE